MISRQRENIHWLEFEQLQEFPHIVHGVFTRSHNVYDPEKRAHKSISEHLGLPQLITARQIHGHRVAHLPEEKVGTCDGMMTQAPHLPLLIQHADCQAALFYDPIHRAIANVHCGWRGNVQNIYRVTIQKMGKKFRTKPQDLLVCISPSLGPKKSEFRNHMRELPQDFYPFQIAPNYFDLWEISKMQLLREGVLPDHIELANLCTYEEAATFFSYRREKKTGGNGTVIALKH